MENKTLKIVLTAANCVVLAAERGTSSKYL